MKVDLRIQALGIALKDTPTRWWGTHTQNMKVWDQAKRMMKIRFGQNQEYIQDCYVVEKFPSMHIDICVTIWKETQIPKEEWVHQFIHTLNVVPINWYVEQEWT